METEEVLKKIDESDSIVGLFKDMKLERTPKNIYSETRRALKIQEEKRLLKAILVNRCEGIGVITTCEQLSISAGRYYTILRKAGVTINEKQRINQKEEVAPQKEDKLSPSNELKFEIGEDKATLKLKRVKIDDFTKGGKHNP